MKIAIHYEAEYATSCQAAKENGFKQKCGAYVFFVKRACD